MARFSPLFLDELRAKVPVSEVVGKHVKLKKAGREWVGLSPFNKEKSPSFTVNDQKGFYHDFSSGKHGDIVAFLMEIEGIPFPLAVERLASMAGMPLPKHERDSKQHNVAGARDPDGRFNDWKEKARSVGVLEEAIRHGAKMKKVGGEWKGPCPACGGTDRFSVNDMRGKWFCRGASIGGSDAIGMVQHVAALSFKEAVESITGEPCPTGPAKPLSEEEKAERNRQRIKNEEAQRQRQAQEAAYQEQTTDAALRIWESSKPIDGTLAQTYLYGRGIPPFETDVLRFHPALPYPGKSKPYPALICRVDDMGGELCAIWRIYLNAEGGKALVDNPKLGLGPASGGAVRIGGIGPKVGIAEGIESALGFWFLTGRKYPVLAALSTSGMIGIELPLGVEHVVIVPDGDRPIKKQGNEYVPAVPAGRKAAETLRARLLAEGLTVTIAAEPGCGLDYNDLWKMHARELA